MNKEFISYEQALELKELGFDEHCFGYYVDGELRGVNLGYEELGGVKPYYQRFGFHTITNNDMDNSNKVVVSTPLYQQAFRWFREKYGYDIHIRGAIFRASYVIGVPKEINIKSVDGYPVVITWDYIIDETGERKTYEEAEHACLNKLIEIKKIYHQ